MQPSIPCLVLAAPGRQNLYVVVLVQEIVAYCWVSFPCRLPVLYRNKFPGRKEFRLRHDLACGAACHVGLGRGARNRNGFRERCKTASKNRVFGLVFERRQGFLVSWRRPSILAQILKPQRKEQAPETVQPRFSFIGVPFNINLRHFFRSDFLSNFRSDFRSSPRNDPTPNVTRPA